MDLLAALSTDEFPILVNDNRVKFCDKYEIVVKLDGEKLNLSATDDVSSFALTNILQKKGFNNINHLFDLVEYIKNDIKNVKHHCVSCGNRLTFQSDDYVTCGDKNCDYRFEELNVGDILKERVGKSSESVFFHLRMAFHAIKSINNGLVFEPFPNRFLLGATGSEISCLERGTLSALSDGGHSQLKDLGKIVGIIQRWDKRLNRIFEIIELARTDAEIRRVIGEDEYILLRFILMTCKADIRRINIDEIPGLECYEVFHEADKSEAFKKLVDDGGSSYLFHGSPHENWYSIIRNGLKNCSSTKLMRCGQAHGQGIYFSDSVAVAASYAKNGFVGVFELAADKTRFNKTKFNGGGSIYVVPDEKLVQLRYLILPKSDFHLIDDYFSKTVKEKGVFITSKCIKRVTREYKKLLKLRQQQFTIELDGGSVMRWRVLINENKEPHTIYLQMAAHKIEKIEMEIRFPENFPFDPPFIWIVKPRFKSLTGNITDGGSICMELLTSKGWSPSCSMESLIISIISEIIEGGGELDESNLGKSYSFQGAKEAHVRMARGHGWI